MSARKKRNPGWFKKGNDPRRRRGFEIEESKRGYAAALAKAMKDAHLLAWLQYRVRGYFRARKRAKQAEALTCSKGG